MAGAGGDERPGVLGGGDVSAVGHYEQRPDLLSIIGADTRLHRVTAKEFAAPCPFCGGTDRFRVNTETQRWWCRQCSPTEHWSDAYEYLQRRDNLTFIEVKKRMEGDNGTFKSTPPAPKPVIAHYDYHDGAGTVVARKQRHADKSFSWAHPNGKGWVPGLGGIKAPLYHLPSVITSPIVYVVEGEKDADTLAALGFVATTAGYGARGSWHTTYTDALRGRSVILLADKDEAGEVYARTVTDAVKLAAKAFTRLILPGPEKDVTDWITAGHTADELRALSTPKVLDQFGFEAQTADLLEGQEFPPLLVIVDKMLYEGCTILAGSPKTGKSLMMLGMACAIALGGKALGVLDVVQADVLYMALEDGPRRVQRRLRKMLEDTPFPKGLHMVYKCDRPLGEGLADGIRAYLDLHPTIKVVIVDTLARARKRGGANGGGKVDVFQQQYEELSALADLAQSRRICIVVLHHTRKNKSDDAMDMVNATQGLAAAVDSVLVLQRSRMTEDATLSVMGRDLDEEHEMGLRWDAMITSYTYVGDASEVSKRKQGNAVIAAMKAGGGDVSIKDIAIACEMPYNSAASLLRRMVDDGQIRIAARGRYSLLFTPPAKSAQMQNPSGGDFALAAISAKLAGEVQKTDADDFCTSDPNFALGTPQVQKPEEASHQRESSEDGGDISNFAHFALPAKEVVKCHCGHYQPKIVGGELLCGKCFSKWPIQPA